MGVNTAESAAHRFEPDDWPIRDEGGPHGLLLGRRGSHRAASGRPAEEEPPIWPRGIEDRWGMNPLRPAFETSGYDSRPNKKISTQSHTWKATSTMKIPR